MGKFLRINTFSIEVCINVLCVLFVKRRKNLFIIYFFNVLMLCIFGVGFRNFFLILTSLMWISFLLLRTIIKNDDSPLINLIKIIVITFSIWMIWYNRLSSSLFLEFFINRYKYLSITFLSFLNMGFGLISPYFLVFPFFISFFHFNNTFFMWW